MSAEPVETPLMGNWDLCSCSEYASSKVLPITSDESSAKQLELLEENVLTDNLTNLEAGGLDISKTVKVVLRLETNFVSYLAEISALHKLAGEKR